jgi:broad-specificity NMP kinase
VSADLSGVVKLVDVVAKLGMSEKQVRRRLKENGYATQDGIITRVES